MNKSKRATIDTLRLHGNCNLWWLGIKVARLSLHFYLLSVFSMTILSSGISKPLALFLNPIETLLFDLYPLRFSSCGIICSGTELGNPQTILKQFRKPFSPSSAMFVNGFVTSPGKVNSLSQEKKDKTSKILYTPFSFTGITNTSLNSMSSLEVNQVKFGSKLFGHDSEINSIRHRKRALQLRNHNGRGSDLYDETSENNENENDRHKNQANDQYNIYEKLLIVCGPSGVGKSTLIKRLMAEYPSLFGFSISHTTRLPRPGEVEGVDYYYISKSEFETAIGDEEKSESDNQTTVENAIDKKADTKKSTKGKTFLEYARVHGNLYGTSFKSILDLQTMKKIGILDIDVQGVKNIKNQLEKYKQSQVKNSKSITISNIGNTQKSLTFCPIYLFVAPPDPSKLEERLRGRNTEDEESLAKRLVNAKNEIEYGRERGNFDYILVNDQVEDSYKRLKAFIKTQYGETIFDL